MLSLPIIELFLRLIPEGFLFIFAAYVFSKTTINRNKYILSSILLGTIGYFIRFFPIDYGVHSVLTLILYIVLVTNINKINIVKSIQTGIINMIFLFICEGINVFIIQFIFKRDLNIIFKDPILKTIYGVPSLIIFTLIVGIYYFILHRRTEMKYVSNRNIS
jgi:hypothetical protein